MDDMMTSFVKSEDFMTCGTRGKAEMMRSYQLLKEFLIETKAINSANQIKDNQKPCTRQCMQVPT